MTVWPPSLPQRLLLDGYGDTADSGSIRTDMDAGPAFVRQRFTAVSTQVAGSLVLTRAQTQTLDTFFHQTLQEGSQPFTWVHPRTGAAATMRFNTSQQLQYSGLGRGWYHVQLALEILP